MIYANLRQHKYQNLQINIDVPLLLYKDRAPLPARLDFHSVQTILLYTCLLYSFTIGIHIECTFGPMNFCPSICQRPDITIQKPQCSNAGSLIYQSPPTVQFRSYEGFGERFYAIISDRDKSFALFAYNPPFLAFTYYSNSHNPIIYILPMLLLFCHQGPIHRFSYTMQRYVLSFLSSGNSGISKMEFGSDALARHFIAGPDGKRSLIFEELQIYGFLWI